MDMLLGLILQSVTILSMIGATFFVIKTFGPWRLTFALSRAARRDWDRLVEHSLGNWLTVCSIFATITSFATVYVFFIGSTRRFGWWVFASVITIWAGSFITNYFTNILVSRPRIAGRIASNDQSGAVFLAFILDKTTKSHRAASIVRFIALTNILAILWLEFAVFSDIAWKLAFVAVSSDPVWKISDIESSVVAVVWGTVLLFVCAFAVIYFTLRFGLRGFTFACFTLQLSSSEL
jgi:hypothetical protein